MVIGTDDQDGPFAKGDRHGVVVPVCLPCGTAVGAHEIRTVCQIIEFAVEHGAQVSSSLRAHNAWPTGQFEAA